MKEDLTHFYGTISIVSYLPADYKICVPRRYTATQKPGRIGIFFENPKKCWPSIYQIFGRNSSSRLEILNLCQEFYVTYMWYYCLNFEKRPFWKPLESVCKQTNWRIKKFLYSNWNSFYKTDYNSIKHIFTLILPQKLKKKF